MDDFRVTSIVPDSDSAPITVRFIRKWLRNNNLCYVVIDKYGDAIQPDVHYLDKDFFEKKVTLLSCYILDNYICTEAPASVTHLLRALLFRDGDQHLLPPPPGSQTQHLRVEDRNRRTISELLHHLSEGNQGQVFTCVASIKSYIKGRPWYYTGCPHCPRQTYNTKQGWRCGTHEILPDPKFMYCIGADIEDNTAPTTATFFDDAAATLLGIQCKDMVLKYGMDRYRLPKPMYDVIGNDMIMQLQYARSVGNTSNVFSINKIFVRPPTMIATPPSPSQETTSTVAQLLPTKPTAKRQLYQQEGTSDTKKRRFAD
ncbi:hypothetical protein M8C21_003399 [Ambrosia artemisiifolia]|uniref:Replication factor A C-terminal domain-containing protein n=1 Tax=Ambrosia artemisiifolia TaxID=4212 RepID=A0AAD5C4F3_AMBAR|nr:hypothetical protein M8C21_003399 [Ambrosia artemisiifolia]